MNPPETVSVTGEKDENVTLEALDELINIRTQTYVCCIYDGKPWISFVEDISEEFGDYYINFMHPHGPAQSVLLAFLWIDICWIDINNIVCYIETSSIVTSGRCHYTISKKDMINLGKLCKTWVTQQLQSMENSSDYYFDFKCCVILYLLVIRTISYYF